MSVMSSQESILSGRRISLTWVIQAAAVLILLYLVSVPLFMNLVTAFRGPPESLPLDPGTFFTFDNFKSIYQFPRVLTIFRDTFAFALGSVALAFVFGFTLAFLVERTDMPFKTVVYVTALTPLMMPTIVVVLAWMFMLGNSGGLINVLIRTVLHLPGTGPFDVFSLYGMIIIQGASLIPLAFLFSSSALKGMAPSFEEASAASGAFFLTTLRRVTLPVLRPHLLSLLILMFILSIETFEVPALVGVGAQRQVFATEIYWSLNPSIGLPQYGEAASLALTFLAIAYFLFFEYSRQMRDAARFATVTGKGFRPRQIELGRWKAAAFAFVAVIGLVQVVFPIVVLLMASFMNRFVVPFLQPLPPLTLHAYRDVLTDPRFLAAIPNTIFVAGTSAFIVSTVSSAIAWLVGRSSFPGRKLLDFIASSSVTVPSVVVAFSFLIFYLSIVDWLPVYGTIWILVLVFSYRMTVGYRINLAAITQLSRELEEASEASGAAWPTTFRRIVIPLIMPSFVASFLLVFFLGFRDATLPLIIGSRDTPMLTPLIWEHIRVGELGPAAAESVISLIIMLIIGTLMRKFLFGYVK